MADATVFQTGQILGPGDLTVFLEDTDGNPVNAYSIAYAIYYVDPVTSEEVLIGPANRVPVNPAVGEYYASLMIPNNASTGCYRIRWRFRETAGSPEEGVVQNFVVEGDSVVATDPYSHCVRDLITKMRFLTRDNCLSGDTLVEVDADGEILVVSLSELYSAIGDISPPPPGRD